MERDECMSWHFFDRRSVRKIREYFVGRTGCTLITILRVFRRILFVSIILTHKEEYCTSFKFVEGFSKRLPHLTGDISCYMFEESFFREFLS